MSASLSAPRRAPSTAGARATLTIVLALAGCRGDEPRPTTSARVAGAGPVVLGPSGTAPSADARLAASPRAAAVDAAQAAPAVPPAATEPEAAPKDPAAIAALLEDLDSQRVTMLGDDDQGEAAAIQRVMRTAVPQVRACYQAAMRAAEQRLAGRLTVTLQVAADGRPTSVAADGLAPGMRACVVRVIEALRFAPGEPRKITFPFVFTTAE